MPRPLRIDAPGALHHVTARANGSGRLFLEDADRETFLSLLAEAVERSEWRCGAYCLMGTHYHLLIQTPEPTLAAGMCWLNACYARTFNSRHRSKGHVFRDRYGSTAVETDSHAIELVRYLALNPVRAGLVADPRRWRWSSYPALVGAASPPPFLDLDLSFGLLDQAERVRPPAERLRAFVEDSGPAAPKPAAFTDPSRCLAP